MNKIAFYTAILFTITLVSKSAFSQNPIPSYNVPVVEDPTSFEETPPPSRRSVFKTLGTNPFSQKPVNRAKKTIYIKTKNTDNDNTAAIDVNISAIDGTITYGPYTILELETFSMELDEQKLWCVSVLQSEDSYMDVWFE